MQAKGVKMKAIITLLLLSVVTVSAYADEKKGKEYYDFLIKQGKEAKWEKIQCESPSKKFQKIFDEFIEGCYEVTLENEILPIRKDIYKVQSYMDVYEMERIGFGKDFPPVSNMPNAYTKINDKQYIYVGDNGYYIRTGGMCGTLLTKNKDGNIESIASCL